MTQPAVNPACLHCGKAFRRNRHWQKFCSSKCRDLFHRDEIKQAIRRLRGRA